MIHSQVGWTIGSWDLALGRGTIRCQELGALSFDGSAATVRDFVAGERVHVELAPQGTSFRVLRIWPDDPRLDPARAAHPAVPALRADVAASARAALEALPCLIDHRIFRLDDEALIIQGDDAGFLYGHVTELRMNGVAYLELPTRWDGKTWRLADSVERAYVASRAEVDDSTIVVRIVDEQQRIFFVACSEIAVTRRPS